MKLSAFRIFLFDKSREKDENGHFDCHKVPLYYEAQSIDCAIEALNLELEDIAMYLEC